MQKTCVGIIGIAVLNTITVCFICNFILCTDFLYLAKSFIELVPYLFNIEGVTCFLSEKLSQDALEKFFGTQRQKGRTNDNPTVIEFLKNTQALRVIDSISVKDITGNCRGTKRKAYDLEEVNLNKPLNKRKRHLST